MLEYLQEEFPDEDPIELLDSFVVKSGYDGDDEEEWDFNTWVSYINTFFEEPKGQDASMPDACPTSRNRTSVRKGGDAPTSVGTNPEASALCVSVSDAPGSTGMNPRTPTSNGSGVLDASPSGGMIPGASSSGTMVGVPDALTSQVETNPGTSTSTMSSGVSDASASADKISRDPTYTTSSGTLGASPSGGMIPGASSSDMMVSVPDALAFSFGMIALAFSVGMIPETSTSTMSSGVSGASAGVIGTFKEINKRNFASWMGDQKPTRLPLQGVD